MCQVTDLSVLGAECALAKGSVCAGGRAPTSSRLCLFWVHSTHWAARLSVPELGMPLYVCAGGGACSPRKGSVCQRSMLSLCQGLGACPSRALPKLAVSMLSLCQGWGTRLVRALSEKACRHNGLMFWVGIRDGVVSGEPVACTHNTRN